VVFAHGSVGIGSGCAPSHMNVGGTADGWDPVRASLFSMTGAGNVVVAPDFVGFGYGDAPSYDDAGDEAKSLLDATRATRKVLAAALVPSQVAIVGHSMGGHAALAAQSFAPT